MKKIRNDNFFAQIASSPKFQNFIIATIVLAGILVGIETYQDLHKQYIQYFKIADMFVQGVFTIEIIIRILAFGNKPFNFFKSASNVVDFIITALIYIPLGGSYAAVLRLVRIVRVLRLITALPRLQILVGALVKSFPSMGWISLLLLLQLYVFSVIGNFMFGHNDPEHFGDLGVAILTLFQIITLEGWVEIMQKQPQNFFTILYFIGFILLGTMIVLNLFIGVVINGFEEVKKEIEEEIAFKQRKNKMQDELKTISTQLDDIRKRIDKLNTKRK
jgi:voltage-gated sodium channel